MEKYTQLQGTRDFLPLEMRRRNYLFNTISEVFRLFGYASIETPAMEHLNVLMGKYGEEGDTLLFKILNSGNFLEKAVPTDNYKEMTRQISEKGLRYDLTVPFARFVVQHRNELKFPFKRYQIQAVWRADKPQKGRYREFTQCDADVIGSDSLINEAELMQMVSLVFDKLGIAVSLSVNNRKILAGIANCIGQPDRLIDITTAIDKMDKIGLEAVCAELRRKDFRQEQIEQLAPILSLKGDLDQKLAFFEQLFSNEEVGKKGVEELRSLFGLLSFMDLTLDVQFDPSLARGLSYYTGTIMEVKAKDITMGSICGGGRYDNLTGVFGLEGMSGVGISFGADRIYDVMLALQAFPDELFLQTEVMIANFGQEEMPSSIRIASLLRRAGISTEIYPDEAKLKKQMSYADAKNIPYVIFVGEKEMKDGNILVKNMGSGEQQYLTTEDLCGFFLQKEKS